MKKLFATLSACLLSLCLLVSCGSKMGAVKKAFEKAEYTYTEQKIEDKDSVLKSVGIVNKGLSVAVLFELGSTDNLEQALTELKNDPDTKDYVIAFGNDMKEAAKKLEEKGLVNGNVVILTISPAAIDIFKNA